MRPLNMKFYLAAAALLLTTLLLSGCLPENNSETQPEIILPTAQTNLATPTLMGPTPTPLPSRTTFQPGELVPYTAQTGDTLPALAARFNTSIEEIMAANPIIPADATTMPPGLPMQIPIYYRSFWGTPYQIIPDSQFINGPAGVGFDTADFAARYNGWINRYQEYALGENRTGPELIDLVAQNYSISPRLLLAVSEYLSGALTNPALASNSQEHPFGYQDSLNPGFYGQLIWAANLLNDGYYKWRAGELLEFELADSTLERPDPWQNAATVSLQNLFRQIKSAAHYNVAVSPAGFSATWTTLFGSPWPDEEPHIPGSLVQPGFILPFPGGETWAYTGGPHTAWGSGAPFAAIDFAPASDITGCYISNAWATSMTDGLVVRSEEGVVTIDLDKDGDERTGWVLFYLHVEARDRIPAGTIVSAGDILGHPSCEGGNATGTHIHLARKYNGEWILADSPVSFVMEGWQVVPGEASYQGYLQRFEKEVNACDCATADTLILATGNVDGINGDISPSPTP